MPVARYQLPDGRIARFEVPEGTTPDQAESIAREYFSGEKRNQEKIEWADVPLKALSSAGESAFNYGKGIFNAVTSPIDTASGLADVAAGGMRKAMPETFNVINDAFNRKVFGMGNEPQMKAERSFEDFVDYWRNRFGGEEAIKNTMANDPVGFMADLSLLLGGGAGATAKFMPRISRGLSTASRVTNPMAVPSFAIKKGVPLITGGLTFTGPEASKTAFLAGKDYKPGRLSREASFIENLRGNVDSGAVLEYAKSGLDELKRQRTKSYIEEQSVLRNDPSILNLDSVKKAIRKAAGETRKGGFVYKEGTEQVLAKIAEKVKQFENNYNLDPGYYGSPIVMDALKQSVGDIMQSLPYGTDQRRVATNIYRSVRDDIARQAPNYGKMMKDYENASNQITEIEKTFSLGNKAAQDTGVRKLQSLTRNNVYTSYGHRQNLAEALKKQTGVDLMPPVSGQAMSAVTPRTLAGQFENVGTLLGGIVNPSVWGLLPFQSPRLMGEALYGAGRGYGFFANPMEQELARYGVPLDSRIFNMLEEAGRER